MSLRRKLFYSFTATVIAVLLLLPTTGWLARLQLMPFLSSGPAGLSYTAALLGSNSGLLRDNIDAINATMQHVATAHPSDFRIQYGYALQATGNKGLDRLDALSQRFPNDPRILAAQLRLATNGSDQDHTVRIGRDAEVIVLSPLSEQKNFKPSKEVAPDPAMLARFDALAESGEQYDPNNAYFSIMRAVGYFAAHRDTEAIAAWKRAGEKTEWNDYATEEMQGKSALLLALNGGNEIGSFARMTTSAAILFPHLAQMRAAARLAIVKAIDAEVAGNAEEGFAIRQATRRVGETMQTKSKVYIGNLVGIAITSIASTRPGGIPAIEIPAHSSNGSNSATEQDKYYRPRYDAYTAYLKQIGQGDEAQAYMAAHNAGLQIKDLGRAGMQDSYFGFNAATYRLIACWFGDVLLITGTLLALAFGGIFALIYRFSPRLQKGETLQESARWGIASAIILPLYILIPPAVNLFSGSVPDYIVMGVYIIPVVVLATFLLRRLSGKQIGHALLVMLATVGSTVIVAGVGTLMAMLFASPLSMIMQSGTSSDAGGDAASQQLWKAFIPAFLAGVMTLLPLLMLLAFALFSRMLGIPVAAGVTRGMRAMSIPLACLLMLGWAVCLIPTLHHERASLHELDQWAKIGEVQNYIQLLGKPFPQPGK